MQSDTTFNGPTTNTAKECVCGLHRLVYATAGTFFVLLGFVGVFLPGLPTTPFLLLTTYFYARSFPGLNRRLHSSPLLGPILQDWQRHRGVTLRVKCIAILMVLLAIALMIAFSSLPAAWIAAVLLAASIGLLVIWRLPLVAAT